MLLSLRCLGLIMNRCDVCGKFRKDEEVIHKFTPDSHFSSEDNYYECVYCVKKEDSNNGR